MKSSLNSKFLLCFFLALPALAWQAPEENKPPEQQSDAQQSEVEPEEESSEVSTDSDADEAVATFMDNKAAAERLEEATRIGNQLGDIILLLRALRPDEAMEAIEASEAPEPFRNLMRGWVNHQKGDYRGALRFFEQVDETQISDAYFKNRLKELKATAEKLQHFEVLETANFSIRYQLGADKVMMYYLPDILERIYQTYSKLFDYRRDEKIIVELMPDHELFSYASSLTRRQIETTGTIALCVENRLVVMTPRRVLQGYYWPDTIAHEFVHYVFTKLSRDHMPLWMQEGAAKYFEGRWDDPNADPLGEALETSLAVVLETEAPLLTVEQMMPSFAALPTAALARQAYAQTASMIDFLCKEKGEEVISKITRELGKKDDMDLALAAHYGNDFATFESNWQEWMKNQGYRRFDNVGQMGVSLLDEDSGSEKMLDLEADDHRFQKHVRLGDLLLERNRYDAALKQYAKLPRREGKMPRQAVLRMLACLSPLQRSQEILDLLDAEIPRIQDDTTMLVYQARAYLGLDQDVQARASLERAMRINPFNPDIFSLLAVIHEEAGEEEALARTREVLQILANPGALVKGDSKS